MFLAGIHGVHDDSSINHFRPTPIRPYNAPSFGANTLRLRAALRPTVRVTFMTMAKRRWMKRKRRRTMTVAFTSQSRNWRMSAGTCRKPSRRSRSRNFHVHHQKNPKQTMEEIPRVRIWQAFPSLAREIASAQQLCPVQSTRSEAAHRRRQKWSQERFI